MTERELKCIRQHVATNLDMHDDAVKLLAEVTRLRGILRDVKEMTGDPAIIKTIDLALE